MDKDNNKISEERDVPKNNFFAETEHFLKKHYVFRKNNIKDIPEYKLIGELIYKDLNVDLIYVTLRRNGINMSVPNLVSLLNADFMPEYNPFMEYFLKAVEKLGNDQTDYIDKLANFVKAKKQDKFNYHFKKMLVRSIACSLDNIVNKQAFILIQFEQNNGKTSFLEWLCPKELEQYLASNINVDKDSQIALCENMFINLDELANMGKYDIDLLKSLFSKSSVNIRRPYDRRTKLLKRRANFIGSCNKTEFLTDETGSVRWLCFEIDGIDWNYNKMDIDLVWAQAYTLYKNKFEFKLTREEIVENENENKKHQKLTLEIELIQQYFLPGTKDDNDGYFNATGFLKFITLNYGIPFKSNIYNVGRALRFLGFELGETNGGPYTIKSYPYKFVNRNNNISNS